MQNPNFVPCETSTETLKMQLSRDFSNEVIASYKQRIKTADFVEMLLDKIPLPL